MYLAMVHNRCNIANLHPLEGSYAQQPHCSSQHISSANVKPEPCPRLVKVTLAFHYQGLPSTGDRVRETESECDDATRFVCCERSLHDIWIRAEQDRDVSSMSGLGERRRIDLGRRGEGKEFRVLAFHGCQSDVSVL